MDKVAIYCRLSKEDQDKINRGDDSESIQNQKLLLVDCATNHDMQIFKLYTDDDFAGSDLTRPGWNQMLADAEKGLFNIILCKTQSRFARSSATVENYINGIFIEWGIRFISIVDNIDTNVKSTKKASQIHGLVDQWYLEDLSENIKTVFKKKMRDGQFLGSFTAYGYMKDPNDRHKIVIDEEVAEVVRLIFDLNLKGHGVDTIAQKLTAMNIPTPTEYKKNKGLNFANPNGGSYTSKGIWSTTTLKRILNNEVYIGTLIQGRAKKVSYKSDKVIIAPKDEWVIIENNHEPIISRDIFEKTQELLSIRRKTCKSTAGKKFTPHIFSGRIKCMDCNSTMTKTSGRCAGGHDYFICQLAKKSKLKECTRHSIRYDALEQKVDAEIKLLINLLLSHSNRVDIIKKQFAKDKIDDKKIKETNNLLNKIQQKINDIQKSLSSLYIDKVKKVITEDEFILLKNSFSEEITTLTAQKALLEEELSKMDENNEKINSFIDAVNRHANYKELTFEIVNDFIKCIYIPEPDENGKQKVRIKWNV
jgi:DNA invertase Pin-like site-specific DNA recombinase